MSSEVVKSHYVYKITCVETGEYYIGKRTCRCPIEEDKYMGSGLVLKNKMKAHPERTWVKDVLKVLNDETEAYAEEYSILGDLWETDPLCLNRINGGNGMTTHFSKTLWEREGYREHMSHMSKSVWLRPSFRKKHSDAVKTAWNKDGRRILQSNRQVEYFRDPANRQKKSEAAKKMWENSEMRQRMIVGIHMRWADQKQRGLRSESAKKCTRIRLIDAQNSVYILEGSRRSELTSLLSDGFMFSSSHVAVNKGEGWFTIVPSITAKHLILSEKWVFGRCGRKILMADAGLDVSRCASTYSESTFKSTKINMISPEGLEYKLCGGNREEIPSLLRLGHNFKSTQVPVNNRGGFYIRVNRNMAKHLILNEGWGFGKCGERKNKDYLTHNKPKGL